MIVKFIKEWIQSWIVFAWLLFLSVVASNSVKEEEEEKKKASKGVTVEYVHFPEKKNVSSRDVYLQTVLTTGQVKSVSKKDSPKKQKNSSVNNIVQRFERGSSFDSAKNESTKQSKSQESVVSKPKEEKPTPIKYKRSEILGRTDSDEEVSTRDNTESLWEELVSRYAAEQTAKECDELKNRINSKLQRSKSEEANPIEDKLQEYLLRLDDDLETTNQEDKIKQDLSLEGLSDKILIVIEDDSDERSDSQLPDRENPFGLIPSSINNLSKLKSYETELNLAEAINCDEPIDLNSSYDLDDGSESASVPIVKEDHNTVIVNAEPSLHGVEVCIDNADCTNELIKSTQGDISNLGESQEVEKICDILIKVPKDEISGSDANTAPAVDNIGDVNHSPNKDISELEHRIVDRNSLGEKVDSVEDEFAILCNDLGGPVDDSAFELTLKSCIDEDVSMSTDVSHISNNYITSQLSNISQEIGLLIGANEAENCAINESENSSQVASAKIAVNGNLSTIIPQIEIHSCDNESVKYETSKDALDSHEEDNVHQRPSVPTYEFLDNLPSNGQCSDIKVDDIIEEDRKVLNNEEAEIISPVGVVKEAKSSFLTELDADDEDAICDDVSVVLETGDNFCDVRIEKEDINSDTVLKDEKEICNDVKEYADNNCDTESSCAVIHESDAAVLTSSDKDNYILADITDVNGFSENDKKINQSCDVESIKAIIQDAEVPSPAVSNKSDYILEDVSDIVLKEVDGDVEVEKQSTDVYTINDEELGDEIQKILMTLDNYASSNESLEDRLLKKFNTGFDETINDDYIVELADGGEGNVLLLSKEDIDSPISTPPLENPNAIRSVSPSECDVIVSNDQTLPAFTEEGYRRNSKFTLEDIPEEPELSDNEYEVDIDIEDETVIDCDEPPAKRKLEEEQVVPDNTKTKSSENIPDYLDEVKDLLVPRARRKRARKFKELEEILKVDESTALPKITLTKEDSISIKDVDSEQLTMPERTEPSISNSNIYEGLTDTEKKEFEQIKKEEESIKSAQKRELQKYLSMPSALTEQEQKELQEILAEQESEKIISEASESRLMAFLADVRARLGHHSDDEEEDNLENYMKLPTSLTREEEQLLSGESYEKTRNDFETEDEYRDYIRNKYLQELEEERLRVEEDYEDYDDYYDYDYSYSEEDPEEYKHSSESIITKDQSVGSDQPATPPPKKSKIRKYLGKFGKKQKDPPNKPLSQIVNFCVVEVIPDLNSVPIPPINILSESPDYCKPLRSVENILQSDKHICPVHLRTKCDCSMSTGKGLRLKSGPDAKGGKSPPLDEFEKMERELEELEKTHMMNGVEKKRNDGEKKKKKKKKKSDKTEEKENKKVALQSREDILEKHVGPRIRSFDTAKMKSKFNKPKETTQVPADCRICGKPVFQMEKIVAEKAAWHKNCFRCTECNKTLTLETYQSHEGSLYCKPHFKELFRPKAVIQDEEEERKDRLRRRPRMIVLESKPEALPEDVVRATEKPDYGLEDLQSLNVKQRFSMFENASKTEEAPKLERISVQRSQSLMSKAARFLDGQDDKPNGDLDEYDEEEEDEEESEEESEDENGVVKSRKKKERPMSFSGIGDLKNAWEQKQRREEMSQARKEEIGRFRQLLCAGKNSSLKEMFESGKFDEEDEDEERQKEKVRIEVKHAAKSLREKFEKGRPFILEDEENGEIRENGESEEKHQVNEIFKEAETAKKARNVFKQIDSTISKEGGVVMRSQSFAQAPRENRRSQDISFLALKTSPSTAEVIKAHDKVDDFQVDTTDLVSRFKFFANYEENKKEQEKKPKKLFRITPPRENVDQGLLTSEQIEIGRDPNLIKATDKYEDEVDCRNTKNILQMFLKMEKGKEDEEDQEEPRPLKTFTPPPEGEHYNENSESDEEEYSSDYTGSEEESDEEDDRPKYKDEILEMLSARKAAQLRAKFERYENDIEHKNSQDLDEEFRPSLDTARNLKAMFESKAVEETKPVLKGAPSKVNRFV